MAQLRVTGLRAGLKINRAIEFCMMNDEGDNNDNG